MNKLWCTLHSLIQGKCPQNRSCVCFSPQNPEHNLFPAVNFKPNCVYIYNILQHALVRMQYVCHFISGGEGKDISGIFYFSTKLSTRLQNSKHFCIPLIFFLRRDENEGALRLGSNKTLYELFLACQYNILMQCIRSTWSKSKGTWEWVNDE